MSVSLCVGPIPSPCDLWIVRHCYRTLTNSLFSADITALGLCDTKLSHSGRSVLSHHSGRSVFSHNGRSVLFHNGRSVLSSCRITTSQFVSLHTVYFCCLCCAVTPRRLEKCLRDKQVLPITCQSTDKHTFTCSRLYTHRAAYVHTELQLPVDKPTCVCTAAHRLPSVCRMVGAAHSPQSEVS